MQAQPHVIDISLSLHPLAVKFAAPSGLGEYRSLAKAKKRGDICNESQLDGLSVHSGTHVDAASHFLEEARERGVGTDSLDLNVLTGPVLVVSVPDSTNISAAALESMKLPAGTERVIFRTLNTKRGLMEQIAFDSSYTAMTADGARWLVAHTSVRLVGIDALSVATFEDLPGPHETLLGAGMIVVEGLCLGDAAPGLYTLVCLPLKLVGSDGSPARCVLLR
ncbi:hypothetical protein WJX81_004953 [Elliptochloris bilobata]|uniref:Cyclase family protein n=1 Tax=Elliptochloris bilobata TaxID=381761 RepID=A0AAW1QKE9_9CHLO